MKRAKHNLSNYKLTTGDMGKLYPVGLMEVLPGDTFQHSTSAVIRLSPMVAPVMHPITVRLHHWFVPNRIVWDGWEEFITGGPDGNDAKTIPQIDYNGLGETDNLLAYYGVPPVEDAFVNALPIYGYNAIFNEFYRDQDLDTVRNPANQGVGVVSWEKDYFTTARPWEQKGDAVTIPIGETAPIIADGQWSWINDQQEVRAQQLAAGNNFVGNPPANGDEGLMTYNGGLLADLSQAQAVNVNEFRRAFALQRYAEARARYGSRYTEYLRYLGIRPSDARLQRPEYLGGGKVNVQISEVLQTAPDDPSNAEYGVGDMYGHGIAAMRSNKYRRFFEEHGYIHTFMSVVPKAIYTNGVQRHWLKTDREDFFQKELAHIGQQPVFDNEVFLKQDQASIFGYQDRYDEYRRVRSEVTGEFRTTLDYWHLGRQFADTPVLNSSFLRCSPGKRIFAEQTQQTLWCAIQHRVVARRMVGKRAMSRII